MPKNKEAKHVYKATKFTASRLEARRKAIASICIEKHIDYKGMNDDDIAYLAAHFNVSSYSIRRSVEAISEMMNSCEGKMCILDEAYWTFESCPINEVDNAGRKVDRWLAERVDYADGLLMQGWTLKATMEYTGLPIEKCEHLNHAPENRQQSGIGSFAYKKVMDAKKVYLMWAEGMSQSDIAKELGISRQTVSARLKEEKRRQSDQILKEVEAKRLGTVKGSRIKKKNKYAEIELEVKEKLKRYVRDDGYLSESYQRVALLLGIDVITLKKLVLLYYMENVMEDNAVRMAERLRLAILEPAVNQAANKESPTYKKVYSIYLNKKSKSNS